MRAAAVVHESHTHTQSLYPCPSPQCFAANIRDKGCGVCVSSVPLHEPQHPVGKGDDARVQGVCTREVLCQPIVGQETVLLPRRVGVKRRLRTQHNFFWCTALLSTYRLAPVCVAEWWESSTEMAATQRHTWWRWNTRTHTRMRSLQPHLSSHHNSLLAFLLHTRNKLTHTTHFPSHFQCRTEMMRSREAPTTSQAQRPQTTTSRLKCSHQRTS
jgi:hypothetical protein